MPTRTNALASPLKATDCIHDTFTPYLSVEATANQNFICIDLGEIRPRFHQTRAMPG